MGEWMRILKNRRHLALVFFMLAVNALAFAREQWKIPAENSLGESAIEVARDYGECVEKYARMPLGDALRQVERDYEERRVSRGIWDARAYNLVRVHDKLQSLLGYGDFLDSVEENYESYQSVSVFSESGGYARRNLEKTRRDFEKMRGIELKLANDSAVEAFFGFALSDYIVAALLFALCLQMTEERKNGFEAVIHMAYRGRGRLALRRVGVLLAGSAAACALTYGVDAAIAAGIYGLPPMDCPIQVMERFQKVPRAAGMGEWLLRYAAGRVVAAFFLAAILFFLMSALRELTWGIVAAALLLVAEFLCYELIPVQGAAVALKYLNVFVALHYGECYGMYLNLNLAGRPISFWGPFWALLFALLAAAVAGTAAVCERRYPFAEEGRLSRRARAAMERTRQARNFLTLGGFEFYKQLFFSGGLFVLAILAAVTFFLAEKPTLKVYSQRDAYLNIFYEELGERAGGAGGAEYMKLAAEYMGEVAGEVRESQEEIGRAYEDFQAGRINYAEYQMQASAQSDVSSKREALEAFMERAASLAAYNEQTGSDCRMVNPLGYEKLFGEEGEERGMRYACLSIFFAILLFYPVLVGERERGTRMLIRSKERGREDYFRRVLAYALFGTAAITAMLTGVEYYNVWAMYGFPDLYAPAGSLECLRHLGGGLSIGATLLLLAAARWLVLAAVSGIILLFSSYAARREACLLACLLILLMPAVLLAVGVEACRFISFAVPLRVVGLLAAGEDGGVSLVKAASIPVVLLFGAASAWVAKEQWCDAAE